ncbi:restriction endonuclease subunit S [Acinetobacter radioresistens]|uniref:restriction endonuclease subunit S n=1 Tax=Acinetobacter radioresistens TaxID=40216 RepID=UPI002247B0C0|nr:restriction endonuclease subunit S [Acinetobacter radioresistens]MCX0332705.1 restriction endonuclease subunit S [Acinetobacter radioresistens]
MSLNNLSKKSIGKLPLHIGDGNYSGKYPKATDFIETGIPFISASDFSEGRIKSDNFRFISEQQHETLLKGQTKFGDVLVVTRGNGVGNVAWVDEEFNNCNLNAQLALLRSDEKEIHNKFLYYLLSSPKYKEILISYSSGSAQPQLPIRALKLIELSFPEYDKQKSIAKILSDLDDKIHLNNQINQTLESIAQAIFKSWFIDFEPVRAKIAAKQEGNDPELAAMCAISGKSEVEIQQMSEDDFAELQASAALFPDELVESELGEVPKGWEISKISKIGKVITGKTPSSKIENSFAEKGTFFITPTDIDTEVFVTNTNRYLSEHGEIAIKNSKVDEGSLCITCIGSQMGKVVITPKSAFTNQQINSILLFNSTLRNYIFLNLRQRRDEIFLIGSGGSTMPIINKSTFESLNMILPDLALIRKFDNFISPFFNNILSNSVENIELKNMRDALLPELLAGKINVSMLKDM